MLQHCTEYMLWVNENLKSCRNKNKKEYVVTLTGYCSVAHVRPGVRLIRFRTLFVNKSYRRYAVCRTTLVVAYVRQTIVNSHPGSLDRLMGSGRTRTSRSCVVRPGAVANWWSSWPMANTLASLCLRQRQTFEHTFWLSYCFLSTS